MGTFTAESKSVVFNIRPIPPTKSNFTDNAETWNFTVRSDKVQLHSNPSIGESLLNQLFLFWHAGRRTRTSRGNLEGGGLRGQNQLPNLLPTCRCTVR